MNKEEFEQILEVGEDDPGVEFKRCGAQVEADTFESICSFANRSGGSIFLGVEDDGTVSGVSEKARVDIKRNILNVINNPRVFKPSVAVELDSFEYDGRHVIRVWVPCDAFVHSFKGVIYDRKADVDYALTQDSQVSELYLRKQSTFTEQRIYPFVQESDLELDLLSNVREMAARKNSHHEWLELDDAAILRSAGLYSKSYSTGEEGYNLAAVLLLGKGDVIRSVLPAYKTDAIVRIESEDRCDDRLTVKCNLLRAFPQLESFCKHHLEDRFFLDGAQAVSPRDIIVRELISNILIHREYLSSLPSRIVISADAISTENGSRALFDGRMNLHSFSPRPKNPIIASFFNNIGLADELGSGARNILKYAKAYSDDPPTMTEGEVFKTVVALRSSTRTQIFDARIGNEVTKAINEKGFVTTVDVREGAGVDHKAAQRELAKMAAAGILRPEGNTKGRRYYPIR